MISIAPVKYTILFNHGDRELEQFLPGASILGSSEFCSPFLRVLFKLGSKNGC